MSINSDNRDLRESIDLIESAPAGGVIGPDGTPIALGYDGQGQLREGGMFDAQGRVPLVVIRPGVGRGRGRHLYEADMLREHAPIFSGWKMFLDHESPEARKAAGGLPRKVRDLGGRLHETWWSDSIPADDLHEAGGVMAMVRPVKAVRDLIDDDPMLVEASIAAKATGVHEATHPTGGKVWCVEGIQRRGSVDWVTEGGAGGQVARILKEAYADDEGIELALVESMAPEELDELLEAMAAGQSTEHEPSEEEDMTITPEALAEALAANPTVLAEALQVSTDEMRKELREEVRAEIRAELDREGEVTRLAEAATSFIDSATVPEVGKEVLRRRYALQESGEPTEALNVTADVDAEGKVVKTARVKLQEAIEADVADQRAILAASNPTRVRGQGQGNLQEAAQSTGEPVEKVNPKDTSWGKYLRESAGVDPEGAFALRETPITDPADA